MLESPKADEAAAEGEEGFVNLGASVEADEQQFEVVKPGEGTLDNPADATDTDE